MPSSRMLSACLPGRLSFGQSIGLDQGLEVLATRIRRSRVKARWRRSVGRAWKWRSWVREITSGGAIVHLA